MERSRPELPSDTKPAEAGTETPADDKRKKRKRRPSEPSADESGKPAKQKPDTETESADESKSERVPDSERTRREVTAELAFRERVALRELAERLPPETYQAIERVLAATSAEWKLEKSRYFFTYLVSERTLSIDDRPVDVEQKLAIVRERPPAEPDTISRRVVELVKPDAPAEENVRRLEALRSELAPGDEVRIRTGPEQPEIVVTAEAAAVEPSEEVSEPITRTTSVSEAAPEPERTKPAALTPEAVERIVTEVEADAAKSTAELDQSAEEMSIEPAAATAGTVELPSPVPPETDPEITRPEDITTVADVLATLDREAASLHDLPPISGGAPEDDELDHPPFRRPDEPPTPPDEEASERPDEPPVEPEEPPSAPPDRPPASGDRERSDRRPRTRRRREILTWEPGWTEAVRYPDHGMRQSARKMIRKLAAEYGIKLTPEMAAYLLGIVLKPRLIGGRRVYGLRLNMDTLISVLQVLKYQFNFTRRPSV